MLRESVRAFWYRVSFAFLALGADVLLSRYLGPELKGHYYVLIVTSALLGVVVSLGQDYALNNLGHKHGRVELPRVWTSVILWVTVASVSFAAAVFLTNFSVLGLLYPGLGNQFGTAMSFSLLLALLETLFLLAGMWLLTIGDPDGFGRMRIIRSGAVLVSLAAIIFLADIQPAASMDSLIIAQIGAVCLGVFYAWARGRIRFKLPLFKPLIVLRVGLASYGGGLAERVQTRIAPLVLGAAGFASGVGQLSVALGIAELLLFVSSSVSSVLLGRNISNAHDGGAAAHFRAVRLMGPFAIALSLVTGLVGAVAIPYAYGGAFTSAALCLWILLPGAIARTVIQTVTPYAVQVGLGKLLALAHVIGLIANVGVTWSLAQSLSHIGAAVAYSIGFSLTALFLLGAVRRHANVPWKSLLFPTPDEWARAKARFRKVEKPTR